MGKESKRTRGVKTVAEAKELLKKLSKGWEGYESFAEVLDYAIVMGVNRIAALSRFESVPAKKIAKATKRPKSKPAKAPSHQETGEPEAKAAE